MVSTPKNSLNRETVIPSVKPEVIEFFQNQVDPNMTPEQISDVVESLRPNSQPNPIFGQIVNLLYQENGTNLVSIVIQDNFSSSVYTVSTDPDINTEFSVINVVNLKDFQFRLQEAFNYQSLVNIYCKDNKIDSLVAVAKQIQEPKIVSESKNIHDIGINNIGLPSPGPICLYGSPPCRKNK